MTRRIFMNVKRGMTDDTAVCVFPWEKPLLEEIHGQNATVVTINEMCDTSGVARVEKVKFASRPLEDGGFTKADYAPDLRAQLEAMAEVPDDEDPLHNLDAEFGRMVEKYGMHPEVKATVVEKVYGNAMGFKQVAREMARNPRHPMITGELEDEEIPGEVPLAEMTMTELRAKARESGVEVKGKTRSEIEDALAQRS